MFLNQVQSTVLFTIMRLSLQLAVTYMFTQILSRTYNLTYLERAEAGLLSKIRFVFMTRYHGNNHIFGRSCILIMLSINILLTGLPSLLSKLYPFQMTMLPEKHIFNIPFEELRLANPSPNPNFTTEDNLLSSLGFSLGTNTFNSYNIPAPTSSPCEYLSGDSRNSIGHQIMRCLGEDIDLSYVSYGLLYSNLDPISSNTFFSTTYKASLGDYQSKGLLSYSIYRDWISSVSPMYDPTSVSCVSELGNQQYCHRYSIGYLLMNEGVLITESKFIYIRPPMIYKIDNFNSTYCTFLPTPSLQEKCVLMTKNIPSPPQVHTYGNTQGVMSMTNTMKGGAFEAIWIMRNMGGYLYLQTAVVELSVTAYRRNLSAGAKTALNFSTEFSSPLRGQELFTSMQLNMSSIKSMTDKVNMPPLNKGYSNESIQNITNFILQGMPIFDGGSLWVSPTDLVVTIPSTLVVSVFTVALLCAIGGYLVARGVDSMATRPLSEVLAASKPNMKESFFKKNVAHLTLAQHAGKAKVPPTILVDSSRLVVEDDELQLLEFRQQENSSDISTSSTFRNLDS